MKSVRWLTSYIFMALLGLWLAFSLSIRFMTPAHSQEAPGPAELPPEFATESGGAPQVPTTMPPQQPPAAGELPPPPPSPSAMGSDVGGELMPVGDGATAASALPISQGDEYIYDPTGKRDPFKPFKEIRAENQKKSEILEPLQRWEIERLQIVGILWEVKVPRAMIKDPEGLVHTVLRNSKIGRNEGYVAAIREGEIVVVETFYVDGMPTKETRVIEFKK